MDLPPDSTLLYSKAQIQTAVHRLASETAVWLREIHAREFDLIQVLEGARPFARDLGVSLKVLVPEVRFQRHGVRVRGTDGRTLLKIRGIQPEDREPLKGRGLPILILDDLVDSGGTLRELQERLSELRPPALKTAVLINKHAGQKGFADLCGFEMGLELGKLEEQGLQDRWVFGYGMDLSGKYRELDSVHCVDVRKDEASTLWNRR